MSQVEDDVVALMKKSVIDLTGCLGKTVMDELNGKRVPIKTFAEYIGLYLKYASKNHFVVWDGILNAKFT